MKSIFKTLVALLVMSMSTYVGIADDLQYFRANNQDGNGVFETPATDDTPFNGLNVVVGGNFAQQLQMLDHTNEADNLYKMAAGFNLATANLNVWAQLDDGVLLALETYLSSRHHSETWVKGGYIQFDKLPMFKSKAVDNIMKYLMIKVGHMEINYGDQHFRRSDNGKAIYNPFVGNYIMDAFNTEIGGEVYFRTNGFLAMVGLTNGEIKGNLADDDDRGFATYLKAGWDGNLSDDFRFRLTGSVYMANSSRNLLYSADRTGSRYYYVMVADGEADNFRAGRFDPGFSKSVTAIQINPFLKFGGIEIFGTYEMVSGNNATEGKEDGSYSQIAGEVLYRFLSNEQMYIGGRYNMVSGHGAYAEGTDQPDDISIDRIQVAWGWYLNKYVLLKAEYVMQNYNDYPEGSLFENGSFSGGMLEAVVAF